MSELNFKIKDFNQLSTQDLYAVLQLRSEVFVVEQDCVYLDLDGKDQLAYHVLGYKDLKLIGYNKSVKNLVAHQAKLARRASLDALVCSPFEVSVVRKIFKKEIITPGVQIGKKNYDQKRSMEAKKVNSDWLVIGRSVTQGNIKKNIQKLIKSL